jgi:hypothetical protein
MPLVQDMAMGIPSIRSGLRDDNPASLFGKTSQEGDVSKNSHPRGGLLVARRKYSSIGSVAP